MEHLPRLHRKTLTIRQYRHRRMIALAESLRGPCHTRRKIILHFRPPSPDRLLVTHITFPVCLRYDRIHGIGPDRPGLRLIGWPILASRSEEHTSELQSLAY